MRDRDVREALRERLQLLHAGDAETRIVEEMGVWSGSVRIDVAVINGELCGFELKSDRDTLDRLSVQSDIYSKVFDRVTLVVGSRHVAQARAMIPNWWGCTVARMKKGRVTLTPERPAKKNPAPDAHLIAQLLWKDEALSVLEMNDMARGWRSKSAAEIHGRLASVIPLRQLGEHVRCILKARGGWLRQSGASELDVAVHTVLDPSEKTAGLDRTTGDLIDLGVPPAMRQRSPSSKGNNTTRVANELRTHEHGSGAFRAHAVADQELVVQRVFRVDGEAPTNTRRRQISGNGCVVAKVHAVGKFVSDERIPEVQLNARDFPRAHREAGKVLGNRRAGNRDRAPISRAVEVGKGLHCRDAKGRYSRNVLAEVDDQVRVGQGERPRRGPSPR